MAAGWNDQGGGGRALLRSNRGSTSGTLSGRTRSECGSGTTTPGWRLTPVTKSGERGLDYLYLGQGGSWYEGSYNGEGSEASHEWETTQSVLQESTSTQTVNKTTSYATGSPVTTGGETRGVTAWGVIDETHQSASANRSWGQSGGGWESASGSSYEESIYEQYDYDAGWSETFDAEGTATTSASAGNEVSGWIDTTYTDWTSWSSGCGSGSGSCSGTSGGGSWTSGWGDSYSETVTYPGFYHAGYSAGGDHRGYIGDDYGGASSSGGGYYMSSLAGPESLLDDDAPEQSPQHEPLAPDHHPVPRGRGLANRPDDHPGQGPAAPQSQHPGQGQSILHQRSPVWDDWATDTGTDWKSVQLRQRALLSDQWDVSAPLLSVALPAAAIRYEVDAAGNLLSVTDALGNQAQYTYDSLGNPTSVTDPNGDTTVFAHDASGNLLVLTDPLGNQTAWTYDDAGRMTGEHVTIDGVALSRTFDYDAAGNLLRRVDRNGRVRVFDYDQDGRLVAEIWYNTVADADLDRERQNTITWTYDESGNLLSVVDDFSSYSYAYDSSGRVTTEFVSNAGGPVTVITTEYGTRLDDQPVSRSPTVDGTPDFVNLYEYDSENRLVALRQSGQGGNAVADKLVTFSYTEDGQFVTITRYASLDGTQMVAVSDYTYDQLGRPVSLVHYQDAADPLAAYTWTWEGGGNQIELDVQSAGLGPQFGSGWMFSFGGPFAPAASREVEINPLADHVWTFDTALLGRLVQATSTDGTADYQYDPRGQLIAADYTAGAGLPTAPPDEFYTYDANGNRTNPGYVTGDHNRLISDGTYHYEYDAEGNRTRRTEIASGEITEYHWDHRNRLVRVSTRTTDNAPLTTDTQYAYDTLNRWIARSHDSDGDGPLDFTNTYFVYDGTPPSGSMLDLAAVTKENIGQIVLHFESDAQGDPQLAHRYLWGPAVDQILADEQITDPNAPGNILWPLTDHLNTVRDLAAYDADTATTTIVNHRIYDAYGRITSQSDPDATTLFAFTARPFDPATGLQNNLNRWYDPETGRWLSEDPIAFQASDANLYRYVENAGTSMVDPNGLEPLPNLTDTERRVLELAGEDRQLHATLVQLLRIIRCTKARPKEFPRDFSPSTNQGYCKRYTEALIDALDTEFMDKRGIQYVEIYRAYIGRVYPLYTTHWLVQVTVDGQTFYVDNDLNGGWDHISFEFVDTLVSDGSAEEREFHERLAKFWEEVFRSIHSGGSAFR